MLFYLILIPSLLLLILLYRKWSQVNSYWAVRGVPYSPPHPIFGSLSCMMQENMIEYMKSEFIRHKPSPYYGIWLFWRPAIVVCTPELARRILIKDFDVFRNRFIKSGGHDPIGTLNMFMVDDPVWSSVRKQLTSVFTSAKLRSLHSLKLQKAKELVQRIQKMNKDKKWIDLRGLYGDYTTDIISIAAFGVDGDATLTGDSPMRYITKDFASHSVWRTIGLTSIFFLPELSPFLRVPFLPKSGTDYFRKVFAQVVKQREGSETTTETRDLLDALLKMKQDAQANGEEMDDEVLIAQAAIFLQGGFDTSGVALTFATYELAHSPDVQSKLYHEILEVKQRLDGKDFDSKTLSELTYLQCVMKETVRKYPAMGWLDRVASRDYQLDPSLTIPAGMPVYVNTAALHFDPEYFPDPYKFDPDRFLPENEENIKPFTYMPFGEGPRNCIGLRFGRQTMAYALSHVLLSFELKPLPHLPKPDDVKMDPKSLFLGPGISLSVEFVPRN